ncbi:phage tail protein [Lonsdalea britannica]|uniref:tail fiber assembly protein n=1 Tax=Lonsdalea britannica TaxID=1082704 RepID=UPI000A1EFC32|nr:tail fiber assembly protein [Lonsdalea britannica]OSN01537.1 phage tail protein [Lonsdalea britannica]
MYKFSNGMFYPYVLEDAYKSAGTWPELGVDVDESVFRDFSIAPTGKVLGTDNQGFPCWADTPDQSKEEYRLAAESQRQTLLTEADKVTADWRVELMLGDISDDNKTKLSAWMAYKTAVKAVDVSTAPDVSWPAEPEV